MIYGNKYNKTGKCCQYHRDFSMLHLFRPLGYHHEIQLWVFTTCNPGTYRHIGAELNITF